MVLFEIMKHCFLSIQVYSTPQIRFWKIGLFYLTAFKISDYAAYDITNPNWQSQGSHQF